MSPSRRRSRGTAVVLATSVALVSAAASTRAATPTPRLSSVPPSFAGGSASARGAAAADRPARHAGRSESASSVPAVGSGPAPDAETRTGPAAATPATGTSAGAAAVSAGAPADPAATPDASGDPATSVPTATAPTAPPPADPPPRTGTPLGDDSGGDGRASAAAARRREQARGRVRDRARRRAQRERRRAARARRDARAERDAPPATAEGLADDPVAPPDAPRTVPGLLLDRFRVPPFLLPIYQAAGAQYGIRWEILAAINEIETDYGRNLAVSTAGARGWMQFMPQTWRAYGVDANGDGVRDPDNPVDAIFAAARYLRAAGAGRDVRRAIFAYNHADWYVDSVLLRARVIAGVPADVIATLTGVTQGLFPVVDPGAPSQRTRGAAPSRERPPDPGTVLGPDDDVVASSLAGGTAALLRGPRGAQAIAVQDGDVVAMGHSRRLGRFVRIRDGHGTTYTYGRLGALATEHLAPRPVPTTPERARPARGAHEQTSEREARVRDAPGAPREQGTRRPPAPRPRSVAAGTAGTHAADGPGGAGRSGVASSPRDGRDAPPVGRVKVRVAARPERSARLPCHPGALTLDGRPLDQRPCPDRRPAQEASPSPAPPASAPFGPAPSAPASSSAPFGLAPADRTSADAREAAPGGRSSAPGSRDVASLHGLRPGELRRERLRVGSRVLGGTVLGRLDAVDGGGSRMTLRVRPGGRDAPLVDPRPFLTGWRLLERASAFGGVSGRTLLGRASAGQVLLMSKHQLIRHVLTDDRIVLDALGRVDVASGAIDRRVLATMAFLAANGRRIQVTCLRTGHAYRTSSGTVSAHSTGDAVDIGAIDGTRITPGTQGPGSVTDHAIRLLLELQGAMRPDQIISLRSFPGRTNTLALPDHGDHLHIGFRPTAAQAARRGRHVARVLGPGQWRRLTRRLQAIEDPVVRATPSETAPRRSR